MPKMRWLTRYSLAYAVSRVTGKPEPYVKEERVLQFFDEFNTWEDVPEENDRLSRETAELAVNNSRARPQ